MHTFALTPFITITLNADTRSSESQTVDAWLVGEKKGSELVLAAAAAEVGRMFIIMMMT